MGRTEEFKKKMFEERELRCRKIKETLESLNLNERLIYEIYVELDSDLETLNMGLEVFGSDYEGSELGGILLAFTKKRKQKIEENIRNAHVGNIQNIGQI